MFLSDGTLKLFFICVYCPPQIFVTFSSLIRLESWQEDMEGPIVTMVEIPRVISYPNTCPVKWILPHLSFAWILVEWKVTPKRNKTVTLVSIFFIFDAISTTTRENMNWNLNIIKLYIRGNYCGIGSRVLW